MRKIEEQMLKAVQSKTHWSGGNMVVSKGSDEEGNTWMLVQLYGHYIASVGPDGTVKVNAKVYRQYPTTTTTSRLRALGVDARVKDGVPYIDGKKV